MKQTEWSGRRCHVARAEKHRHRAGLRCGHLLYAFSKYDRNAAAHCGREYWPSRGFDAGSCRPCRPYFPVEFFCCRKDQSFRRKVECQSRANAILQKGLCGLRSLGGCGVPGAMRATGHGPVQILRRQICRQVRQRLGLTLREAEGRSLAWAGPHRCLRLRRPGVFGFVTAIDVTNEEAPMLRQLCTIAVYAGVLGLLLFQPHIAVAQETAAAASRDGARGVQRILPKYAAPKLSRALGDMQRQVQACLPNNYCWKPGLPRCCSGTCISTPKCPGVQSCLCK